MELRNSLISFEFDEITGSVCQITDRTKGKQYLNDPRGNRLFKLIVPTPEHMSRPLFSHQTGQPTFTNHGDALEIAFPELRYRGEATGVFLTGGFAFRGGPRTASSSRSSSTRTTRGSSPSSSTRSTSRGRWPRTPCSGISWPRLTATGRRAAARRSPSTMRSSPIRIAEGVEAGGEAPLVLIAGPDVVESEDHALRMAGALAAIARARGVPLVFKASYDKGNRTSASSFRGPGLEEGLRILARVKAHTGLPVTTDVHETRASSIASIA